MCEEIWKAIILEYFAVMPSTPEDVRRVQWAAPCKTNKQTWRAQHFCTAKHQTAMGLTLYVFLIAYSQESCNC